MSVMGLNAVEFRHQGHRQGGMSMVELLVGIAIGLLVVAGASMLTAGQLSDNRRMMLEIQLQQDLRASVEIMTRELRRAGAVSQPMDFVWASDAAPGVDAGIVDDMTPTAVAANFVTFRYVRGPQGQLGFRLNGTKLQTRLVATPGAWQDLTDNNTMEVLAFAVTPRHAIEPSQTGAAPQRMPCPKLCPGDTTDCWPTVRIREYTVSVTGRAKADAAMVRTLASVVRVRNDELITVGGAVCPA